MPSYSHQLPNFYYQKSDDNVIQHLNEALGSGESGNILKVVTHSLNESPPTEKPDTNCFQWIENDSDTRRFGIFSPEKLALAQAMLPHLSFGLLINGPSDVRSACAKSLIFIAKNCPLLNIHRERNAENHRNAAKIIQLQAIQPLIHAARTEVTKSDPLPHILMAGCDARILLAKNQQNGSDLAKKTFIDLQPIISESIAYHTEHLCENGRKDQPSYGVYSYFMGEELGSYLQIIHRYATNDVYQKQKENMGIGLPKPKDEITLERDQNEHAMWMTILKSLVSGAQNKDGIIAERCTTCLPAMTNAVLFQTYGHHFRLANSGIPVESEAETFTDAIKVLNTATTKYPRCFDMGEPGRPSPHQMPENFLGILSKNLGEYQSLCARIQRTMQGASDIEDYYNGKFKDLLTPVNPDMNYLYRFKSPDLKPL